MKQTVNGYDFRRAFETLRPNQFSYEALGVLFDYFEEYEAGTGEEIELEVVAICCDWAEYATATEAAQEMSDWKPDADLDEDANEAVALAYLQDNTTALEVPGGGFVVLAF